MSIGSGISQNATRVWGAATAVLGLGMVARPRFVAELSSGSGRAPAAVIVQVLGSRQLVQGFALIARPQSAVVGVGSAVDALHAASMVGAALVSPSYRRSALVSAAVAGASAAVGWAILRTR